MELAQYGQTPGVNIVGFVGAVAVTDTPTSPARPHLFVSGQRRQSLVLLVERLDLAVDRFLGASPRRRHVRGLLGAVNAKDTPTAPGPAARARLHRGERLQPLVPVVEWIAWSWAQYEQAAGSEHRRVRRRGLGEGHPHAAARPHLFVSATTARSGAAFRMARSWHGPIMGQPPTANIRGLLGAANVKDTPPRRSVRTFSSRATTSTSGACVRAGRRGTG